MTAQAAIPAWIAEGLLEELTALTVGTEVSRPIAGTDLSDEETLLRIGRAIVSLTERTDIETSIKPAEHGQLMVWRCRRFGIEIGGQIYSWRECTYLARALALGSLLQVKIVFFQEVDAAFRDLMHVSLMSDLKRTDESDRHDLVITCVDRERLSYTIFAPLAMEAGHEETAG